MKLNVAELPKDKIVLLASVGAGLITAVIYIAIFMPALREFKNEYASCKSLEMRVATARNLIAQSGRMYGDRTMIGEDEASIAIDELTKHGKEKGINFISIHPRDVSLDTSRKYKIMPIEMEIKATDKQFADFIGSLDMLKKGLMTVDNFELAPSSDNKNFLIGKITVDMYLSGTRNAE